ncbi:hypothetical protein B0H19DRAFT_1064611 [Mycena capillaripes]|nr:hypothetical protein B0H19DRAFT_1064611 [Mycena capillaripes]
MNNNSGVNSGAVRMVNCVAVVANYEMDSGLGTLFSEAGGCLPVHNNLVRGDKGGVKMGEQLLLPKGSLGNCPLYEPQGSWLLERHPGYEISWPTPDRCRLCDGGAPAYHSAENSPASGTRAPEIVRWLGIWQPRRLRPSPRQHAEDIFLGGLLLFGNPVQASNPVCSDIPLEVQNHKSSTSVAVKPGLATTFSKLANDFSFWNGETTQAENSVLVHMSRRCPAEVLHWLGGAVGDALERYGEIQHFFKGNHWRGEEVELKLLGDSEFFFRHSVDPWRRGGHEICFANPVRNVESYLLAHCQS